MKEDRRNAIYPATKPREGESYKRGNKYERRCKTCNCILSRYNREEYCTVHISAHLAEEREHAILRDSHGLQERQRGYREKYEKTHIRKNKKWVPLPPPPPLPTYIILAQPDTNALRFVVPTNITRSIYTMVESSIDLPWPTPLPLWTLLRMTSSHNTSHKPDIHPQEKSGDTRQSSGTQQQDSRG